MSIVPREFIESSTKNISENSPEIDLRNACSRAYYSVFHMARIVADENNLPAPRSRYKGSHQRLADRYLQDYRYKGIGDMLHKLHKRRCVADYEIHLNFSALDAMHHINLCNGLIVKLETIIKL